MQLSCEGLRLSLPLQSVGCDCISVLECLISVPLSAPLTQQQYHPICCMLERLLRKCSVIFGAIWTCNQFNYNTFFFFAINSEHCSVCRWGQSFSTLCLHGPAYWNCARVISWGESRRKQNGNWYDAATCFNKKKTKKQRHKSSFGRVGRRGQHRFSVLQCDWITFKVDDETQHFSSQATINHASWK